VGHNSNGKVNQGTTHVEARERIQETKDVGARESVGMVSSQSRA